MIMGLWNNGDKPIKIITFFLLCNGLPKGSDAGGVKVYHPHR